MSYLNKKSYHKRKISVIRIKNSDDTYFFVWIFYTFIDIVV
ncbi:hypothetical protein NT03LS_1395 [Listeria seeligeri FSL N1-067]|uniref:Uncharacterized protein n=1 Tax=Listeria seeligeri FSL N1-067 TaxID=702453 RepID=E3ZPL5_LISSE|nr:hypothetical protein NT03LS_1395 [Listeria seeligeri FSL N1-067]